MEGGLTSEEAAERIRAFGYNELPAAKSRNVWEIAFEVIKEPMFILLIVCGLLYVLIGDYTEGITLLCSIFLILFITFYQYRKTEKALDALKQISAPRALVIRDGEEIRIAGREVVPGDYVIIHEGDRVPADGVLTEGFNLTIDESLLTGESVPVEKSTADSAEEHVRVYSGTLVVQGRGTFRAESTGVNTEFGKIGGSLQQIEQSETHLQREMKFLIRRLFIGGLFVSVLVILAYYLTRHHFIQAVLSGLATAMAMLPEEFPVVLTVFLAIGVWRLSGKNVLTRRPSAIETLGSATVLCSDKTGTITENRMAVVSVFSGGSIFHETAFDDQRESIHSVLEGAYLATDELSVDPMEKAIVQVFRSYSRQDGANLRLSGVYPFSKKLMATARVYADPHNASTVFCKGAPEVILSLTGATGARKKEIQHNLQVLAEKGQRVLGVASARWSSGELPESLSGFDFEFLGLIGFEDPIRPEVPAAIQECYTAGIKVVMITGDYPSTARSIGLQAGMMPDLEVLTGAELDALSDEDLGKIIGKVGIFARTIPEQKLRIIKALKANGEVVAMTGDGVNDAPALKAADIGVAMGKKGTDVAREASSLVLLDDNFSSIVSSIRSGRRIYDNLQKAMFYIIAIHVAIIGLTLLPAVFPSLPILLMPMHIVFLELIIDPICSVAYETEIEEKGIMNRPPRDPKKAFFGTRKILESSLFGMLLLALVFAVYFTTIGEGHTDGEVRLIAFSSLIIGNMFLIVSTLSKTRNVIDVIREKNKALLVILGAAFGILLLLVSVPYLRTIFSFDYPGIGHFLVSFIGSIVLLLILESIKYVKNKRAGRTLVS